PGKVEVIHGDNLEAAATLESGSFTIVYLDPPFNTGRVQERDIQQVRRAGSIPDEASSGGFHGLSYERVRGMLRRYDDSFDDYGEFLIPRLEEAWRLLADDGTLYLHLDYREAHYAKVMLDAVF